MPVRDACSIFNQRSNKDDYTVVHSLTTYPIFFHFNFSLNETLFRSSNFQSIFQFKETKFESISSSGRNLKRGVLIPRNEDGIEQRTTNRERESEMDKIHVGRAIHAAPIRTRI